MDDVNINLLVGDITSEHYGWLLRVKDTRLGYAPERDIYLVEHRAWEYQGKQKIGLVSKETERSAEYHYSADTPCRLVRQWRKPRKSRSKKTA